MLNTIVAIKNSDAIIFEQVVRDFHERLYYFILRKTQSEYLATETVQLTFIKLWDNRHRLDEELSLSAQIFRIARTTLIDLLRKEKTVHQLKQNYTHLKQADYEAPSVQAKLSEKELQEKLREALDKLPPIRRNVFELSRVKGMSYKEIATSLNISVRTVENHISNTLKQLRAYLGALIIFLLISGLAIYFL